MPNYNIEINEEQRALILRALQRQMVAHGYARSGTVGPFNPDFALTDAEEAELMLLLGDFSSLYQNELEEPGATHSFCV